MSIIRIDNASDLDPTHISFENLRWKCGTGVDTSTGKGVYKRSSYRSGVMTELGDIEENLWYQLVEQLIQSSEEQFLLDALTQWEKEHTYQKASLVEIHKEALHLHSCRIFDDPQWVDFIPFNRQYRPDVLERAHIALVVTECCGLPGEVTREQICKAYDGTICCPHCGRWSHFTPFGHDELHAANS